MEIFGQNTLASFRNLFNDEIQLLGDWRVALSEIIFPTKIEHITNRVLTSGANVISRPYNGERLGFMPGTFDTVPQLLATIKRTVVLPNFLFREIKGTGIFEIVFRKYEGIRFPSDEIPSIIVFKKKKKMIPRLYGWLSS